MLRFLVTFARLLDMVVGHYLSGHDIWPKKSPTEKMAIESLSFPSGTSRVESRFDCGAIQFEPLAPYFSTYVLNVNLRTCLYTGRHENHGHDLSG